MFYFSCDIWRENLFYPTDSFLLVKNPKVKIPKVYEMDNPVVSIDNQQPHFTD